MAPRRTAEKGTVPLLDADSGQGDSPLFGQTSRRPASAESAAVDEIIAGAQVIGVSLSTPARARFERYIEALLLWRRRAALTAAATPTAIARIHILDSLQVARFLKRGDRVADLGSGAGFPGIPLAIACAHCSFLLVESVRKKANFLREVIRLTDLANVEVLEKRAETLRSQPLEPCDVVVSRAVWSLTSFLGLSECLLGKRGLAIAMKGPRGLDEAKSYDGDLIQQEIFEYTLMDGRQRSLILYRKP